MASGAARAIAGDRALAAPAMKPQIALANIKREFARGA
jgi:hypothetical protein